MTSMTHDSPEIIIGGVDTHGQTHHAAVIDSVGRQLADREFRPRPVATGTCWTGCGHTAQAPRPGSRAPAPAAGVEGTGAYGAELARVLTAAGVTVIDVDRPDRKTRRMKGKSDPIDAYAAAAAVLAGRATGIPKSRNGIVEAIRVLRITRRSAIKARPQTMNQIRSLLLSAPAPLREQVSGLNKADLIRPLARRCQNMDTEIADLDAEISPHVTQAAPALLELFGVGPDTAGDNPERMRFESAFVHLIGTAPIPASTGRTHRHRLNRGGDRAANNALHIIVLVRMRFDQRTRAYVTRRATEGLATKDIIRCRKRYVAREIYHALTSS